VQVVLRIDEKDTRTLQQQVFHQIRALILEGRLRSGDPVPASRELSQQLGVSRNTVLIAYEHLLSEGYLESRANVGTFVSSALPEMSMSTLTSPANDQPSEPSGQSPAPACMPLLEHSVISPNRKKDTVDFWVGRSDGSAFPAREWRRILDTKLRHAKGQLSEYHDPRGLREFRQALADHIGPTRGVLAKPEDVVCVGGSQDGLALIARAFSRTFRTFIHEDPCYLGARAVFSNFSYDTVSVPVDRDGLRVDLLPETGRSLLYVTPSHQYPTGVTLSLERRLQLLQWAERTDSIVIEDDYDGDFRYEGTPLTALRGLDRAGRVIYLGTFSKSFGPAIRIGYLVSTAELSDAFAMWKGILSNGQPWLEQAAMADFITGGSFRRHLRRIRSTYMARRDLLARELTTRIPGTSIHGMRGGMHISARLPKGICAETLQKAAAEHRIAIYRARDCGAWLSPSNTDFDDLLVLGYAAVSDRNIRKAVDVLAHAAEQQSG